MQADNYYSGCNNNRSTIICDFCKRLGHIRGKYYKLHAYPQGNNCQNCKPNPYNNGQRYRQINNLNFKGKEVVANGLDVPNDKISAHGGAITQRYSREC